MQMKMLLTKLREDREETKRAFGARCDTHPIRIGQIENRRVRPYDVEMARIAAALGWPGDPRELLEDVSDDDQSA